MRASIAAQRGWKTTGLVHVNPSVEPGTTVRLSAGVVSDQNVALSYLWSQTNCGKHFFFGTTSDRPTVQVSPDAEPQRLEFKVVISDGNYSVVQTVVLDVRGFGAEDSARVLQVARPREDLLDGERLEAALKRLEQKAEEMRAGRLAAQRRRRSLLGRLFDRV